MRDISDMSLAVVIPLLAAKIQELKSDLKGAKSDERSEIQEMLHQYDHILDSLRKEYEKGQKEDSNLPSFDSLIEPFKDQ